MMRWKLALTVFEIPFDGRLATGRKEVPSTPSYTETLDTPTRREWFIP